MSVQINASEQECFQKSELARATEKARVLPATELIGTKGSPRDFLCSLFTTAFRMKSESGMIVTCLRAVAHSFKRLLADLSASSLGI